MDKSIWSIIFFCTECSFSDIFIQSMIYISKLRLTYWCTVYSLCYIHIYNLRLFVLLVLVELHDHRSLFILSFHTLLYCTIFEYVQKHMVCFCCLWVCTQTHSHLYFSWKCSHRSYLMNSHFFNRLRKKLEEEKIWLENVPTPGMSKILFNIFVHFKENVTCF